MLAEQTKNSYSLNMCPCGKTDRADLSRIHRTTFMKIFLFWLPIKRYKCYSCMTNRWVIDKDK